MKNEVTIDVTVDEWKDSNTRQIEGGYYIDIGACNGAEDDISWTDLEVVIHGLSHIGKRLVELSVENEFPGICVVTYFGLEDGRRSKGVALAISGLMDAFLSDRMDAETFRCRVTENVHWSLGIFMDACGYRHDDQARFWEDMEAGKFGRKEIVEFCRLIPSRL